MICRAAIPIAGLTILSALGAQVGPPAKYGQSVHGSSKHQIPGVGQFALELGRPIDAEVQTEHLDIIDRPDDIGFITGRLHRGDRLLIRPDHSTATGWLAIVPPPTAICWIEQSSLESEDEATGLLEHDRAGLAWVSRLEASIRSGHTQARLPGPPVGTLPKGTMVQLVDRPPLSIGQGPKASRWLAIVPPADHVSYVRALGVRWLTPARPVPPAVLARASYEEPMQPSEAVERRSGSSRASSSRSPEIAAELQRVDGIYQVIIASQPIEQWHFETVRGLSSLAQAVRRSRGPGRSPAHASEPAHPARAGCQGRANHRFNPGEQPSQGPRGGRGSQRPGAVGADPRPRLRRRRFHSAFGP